MIMYISQNRERLVILFNGEEEWRWTGCFELVSEPPLKLLSTPLKISSRVSRMWARDRPSRKLHCLHECIPHVSSDRAGTNIFYMNPRHLFESVFEQRIINVGNLVIR
jgi:hypothetical protein